MVNPLRRAEEAFLDFLFPRICVGCGCEGAWVCHACAQGVVERSRTLKGKTEGLGEVTSFFNFKEPIIRELLHNLKYNGIREIAGVFRELVENLCEKEGLVVAGNNTVVPVPTSRAKLKARGYNQAEELARELGCLWCMPVCHDLLLRTGKKKSQVGMGKEDRNLQVEGVFMLNEKRARDLGGGSVILIDDLMTTGSTLAACVKTLVKKVGSIQVVTIAREE